MAQRVAAKYTCVESGSCVMPTRKQHVCVQVTCRVRQKHPAPHLANWVPRHPSTEFSSSSTAPCPVQSALTVPRLAWDIRSIRFAAHACGHQQAPCVTGCSTLSSHRVKNMHAMVISTLALTRWPNQSQHNGQKPARWTFTYLLESGRET